MDHADQAYVTLATNDPYSKGALVLAHSLRETNTSRKLVIIIGPLVSQNTRNALSQTFDEVVEVNVLNSNDEAHLALMKRPELGITFTKIHCWNLTQYQKCVFMDADTMVLQNIDELFERDELSAAPDSGWPDIFNSGVFVYKPSQETFKALIDMATKEGSFDGGDQGLLNAYFCDWAHSDIKKHLPFLYNLHITLSYTYAPAFKRFGGDAKVVHFLGSSKPWGSQAQQSSFPGFQHHCAKWHYIYNTHVRDRLEKKDNEQTTFPQQQHSHSNGNQESNQQLGFNPNEYVGSSSPFYHHHHLHDNKVEEHFISQPHVDFSCSNNSSDIGLISQAALVINTEALSEVKAAPAQPEVSNANASSAEENDPCFSSKTDDSNNYLHETQFALHEIFDLQRTEKIQPDFVENSDAAISVDLSSNSSDPVVVVADSAVCDISSVVTDDLTLAETEMSECITIQERSYDSFSTSAQASIDPKLNVENAALVLSKQVNANLLLNDQLQGFVIESSGDHTPVSEPAELNDFENFVEIQSESDDTVCASLLVNKSKNEYALQAAVPETDEERETRITQERNEHQRAWETGYVDYLGRDSFDNILKHLNSVMK